jgi:glucose/arabinose dehydrogenase
MPRAPFRPRRTTAGAAAASGVLAVLLVAGCSGADPNPTGTVSAPVVSTSPGTSASSTSEPSPSSTTSSPATATIAQDLDVPWGLAFLPDGSALVTLRDEARLLQVRAGQPPTVLGTVPGVRPDGEGGLLGVAVSPDFSTDQSIFVYFTAESDNRVVRLTFADGKATQPTVVLRGIPKAGNHNGGRLAFGPDGFLYVTTGDAGDTDRSQDKTALGGKILRVTKDGKAAPGNPFSGSPVWSYGHRNVQGIAWAPDGRMFASEFGQNTWDELNLIVPGRNYGWPVVEGRAGRSGFTDPLVQWATDDASPSGIAVADGAVWMAALKGQSLWRIPLTSNGIGDPERLLRGEYGRLRDAVAAPDGRLWVLTSNTFRGTPAADDDRVVALSLDSVG